MPEFKNEMGFHQIERNLGDLQNVLRQSRESAERKPSETSQLLMAVKPFMPQQAQKGIDDMLKGLIMIDTVKNLRSINVAQNFTVE